MSMLRLLKKPGNLFWPSAFQQMDLYMESIGTFPSRSLIHELFTNIKCEVKQIEQIAGYAGPHETPGNFVGPTTSLFVRFDTFENDTYSVMVPSIDVHYRIFNVRCFNENWQVAGPDLFDRIHFAKSITIDDRTITAEPTRIYVPSPYERQPLTDRYSRSAIRDSPVVLGGYRVEGESVSKVERPEVKPAKSEFEKTKDMLDKINGLLKDETK